MFCLTILINVANDIIRYYLSVSMICTHIHQLFLKPIATVVCVSVLIVSGQKTQLQFDLSPEVAREMAVKGTGSDTAGSSLEGSTGIEIPREHKVHLQSFGNQSMYVFSEDTEGKLVAEGKVVQKAEMQPHQNKHYLQLKRFVSIYCVSQYVQRSVCIHVFATTLPRFITTCTRNISRSRKSVF